MSLTHSSKIVAKDGTGSPEAHSANSSVTFEYRSVSDTRLFVRRWEPAGVNSPGTVIILHGIGGHGGYYDDLSQHLVARSIGVIAYDRRGHGRSDGRRGYIEGDAVDADDLHELLNAFDGSVLRNSYLLGDSWGALLLLEYSRRYPVAARGIILSSPPVAVKIRGAWVTSIARAIAVLSLNALRGNLFIPAPFPLSCASTDERFLRKVRTDATTNLHMHVNALLVTMRLMRRMRRNAAAITLPTLVLIGTEDRIIDTKAARHLAEEMTNAPVSVTHFPGAQHTLYLDHATPSVADAICAWIGGLRS